MKHMNQADALLGLLGFDSVNFIDFEQYLNEQMIEDFLKRVEGHKELQLIIRAILLDIKEKKQARISAILDKIIPHLREEDFIFKKEYKIVKSVQTAFGKWPQTYGNAFFTDSKYLVDDIFDMA